MHFPWLEAAILIPLVGALWVRRFGDSERGRRWWLFFSGITFLLTLGTWLDFSLLHAVEADDRWRICELWGQQTPIFVIDHLSAPMLPWLSLLFFLTAVGTLQAKVRRFSFSWKLLSEGLALAIFSCKEPWILISLLAAGTVPPFLELRARGKPTRIFVLHMALYIGLLVMGEAFVDREAGQQVHSLWATLPLLIAVLVRSGIIPFHVWITDLFEHATLGTALLFVTPIVGAYTAVRLVLPIAPDWVLRSMGLLSLVTAVYAAGMALIQREGRRFFCYLFLSHSALVLVGLEMVTSIGLTGALCVWLSVGLSLGGFGLTLRALEARRGRLSLADFQGLYEHTPNLAMCFVLTGLASVGFPGTFGFVGMEILVDGATVAYPHVGISVVVAAAINGIAIVQAYFLLFTGTRYVSTVSLWLRARERYAVLTLAALILAGGFFPQPGVESRHRAAEEILQQRAALGTDGKSYARRPAEAAAAETH
jgi:NADH-quinone oxidoreductase subunit M